MRYGKGDWSSRIKRRSHRDCTSHLMRRPPSSATNSSWNSTRITYMARKNSVDGTRRQATWKKQRSTIKKLHAFTGRWAGTSLISQQNASKNSVYGTRRQGTWKKQPSTIRKLYAFTGRRVILKSQHNASKNSVDGTRRQGTWKKQPSTIRKLHVFTGRQARTLFISQQNASN